MGIWKKKPKIINFGNIGLVEVLSEEENQGILTIHFKPIYPIKERYQIEELIK